MMFFFPSCLQKNPLVVPLLVNFSKEPLEAFRIQGNTAVMEMLVNSISSIHHLTPQSKFNHPNSNGNCFVCIIYD